MLSQVMFEKLQVIFSQSQTGAYEKKDIDAIRKAAEQGDAVAQSTLGVMYDFDQGVPQDYKKAVYWYTKAAEQGDAFAQSTLGIRPLIGI